MKINHFEVCIVGGMEVLAAGKVFIPHGQTYKLALINHGLRRCEAAVEINGLAVGYWQVPARCTLIVDRPADLSKPFTFLRPDSEEAKAAGLPAEGKAAQVSVLFVPESIEEMSLIEANSAAPAPVPAGQDKPFTTSVPKAMQHDLDEAVEVCLGLMCGTVPTVSLLTLDAQWALRREIVRLKAASNKAADEDFDFTKARQIDKTVAQKERELFRLEWQAEHPQAA